MKPGEIRVVEDLMALGYSEYEARVYLALLRSPESSGYELSRGSGVPRSKVYEVLEGLVKKGAALEMSLDDRRLFRPLPHRTLLEKHRKEMSNTLERLEQELESYPKGPEEYNFFALSGMDALLARCRETLSAASRTVFVSCWPEELRHLEQHISAARERGVQVAVLVYENRAEDPGSTGEGDVFYHTVTPMQHRQIRQLGRWLLLVVDNIEVTMAQVREAQQVALCSRNELLAFLIAQSVAHDITLVETAKRLGSRRQTLFDDEEWERLQRVQAAATGPADR